MSVHTQALQALIDAFAQLPGIGRKSATRIAFHLVRQPIESAQNLANAILDARSRIRFCEVCQNLCESSPCERCSQPVRDEDLLCVVESPQDLVAIEATREFHGRFHVLHGAISPLEGITPADLKIKELAGVIGRNECTVGKISIKIKYYSAACIHDLVNIKELNIGGTFHQDAELIFCRIIAISIMSVSHIITDSVRIDLRCGKICDLGSRLRYTVLRFVTVLYKAEP